MPRSLAAIVGAAVLYAAAATGVTAVAAVAAIAADARADARANGAAPAASDVPGAPVTWKDCLRQPPAWYGGAEARRVADNVLLYQHDNGGCVKNVDMAAPLGPARRAEVEEDRVDAGTTIDNGATYTPMKYLARVYDATRDAKYREAFLKGVDYLLAAQYPNGGWPQYYPLRRGYFTHITFNDDAMVGVLDLLRAVARGDAPYAFVDADRRARAARAVQKGIDCILRCQVVENGKRTAWCQQHDEHTFAPAPARTFELVSLSGAESAGIVRFLMGVDRPSPAVIAAVDAVVDWLRRVEITGVRVVRRPEPGAPKGYDTVAEPDPAAPPIWARFYQIGTDRPFFSGRDSVMRFRLSEIEYERRNGYRWYGDWPAKLLSEEYPAWKAKTAAGGSSPGGARRKQDPAAAREGARPGDRKESRFDRAA